MTKSFTNLRQSAEQALQENRQPKTNNLLYNMVVSPRPMHNAAYTSFANLKHMENKKK